MKLPAWAAQALMPLVLLAGVLIAALLVWQHYAPGKWLTAAPSVDATPRVPVQIEAPLKVYPQSVKPKLKLPPAYNDKSKAVVAATETKAETVITIVDTTTGEVETLVRDKPLPLLAFERHGQVRIDYGSNGSRQITRISMQQDLIQSKALHGGISATLDSDRGYFVGIGGGFKW